MYSSRPSYTLKPHGKQRLESPKIWDFWGFPKLYRLISKVNIGSESDEKTNRCSVFPFVDTLDSIKEMP